MDVAGLAGGNRYWYAQALWNECSGFLDPAVDHQWRGVFGGIDYVRNERWTYSLLYNYMDAGDCENMNTIFERIEMNSVTLAASYYFMRNAT